MGELSSRRRLFAVEKSTIYPGPMGFPHFFDKRKAEVDWCGGGKGSPGSVV